MKKLVLIFSIGIFSILSINAQNTEAQNALSQTDKYFFIENKGQWPDEVLYLTRIGGLDAWITKMGVLYDFYQLKEVKDSLAAKEIIPKKFEHQDFTKYGQRVWYKLKGNNDKVITEGREKQEEYYNYFIGNDPAKHASNVSLYKEAIVKNIYNGIDARYYFDKGNLRYDFVVHPGADPSQINFGLEGTDYTRLNPLGDLVFNTRFGEVALAQLETYQGTKTNKIVSHFVKTENGWSIAVGKYDSKQTLIIDPLIYSTYLGGSDLEDVYGIVIDASKNAYITGYTYSINYDTTSGAYQTSNAGEKDVFVTKLNTIGTALVYSTYLGGKYDDRAYDIALDTIGNVYITGATGSTNYPITSGAHQTSNVGGDAFVTKLNSNGTALVYSTYLGGSGYDEGYSIAIDSSSIAYVTGHTKSTDYKITSGAYQTSYAGSGDVFVTKLNASGTALVYSTYLGGGNYEEGFSIAIDPSGNSYITGYTESNNYDTTSGAYQTKSGGSRDVFATKLNSKGTALVYSTYLGGSSDERAFSIAIDKAGNAYITGFTGSTNYDITSGAFQTSISGGTPAFVTKLNTTGTALVYSTYLGGSSAEYGLGIDLDASGNAYVTGTTHSINYDTTFGAFQTSYAGNGDAFVTKLNSNGTALVYSTYLGGKDSDNGGGIAVDSYGNAYITGNTGSTDFDTTKGAYQTIKASKLDLFVTKICLVPDATISLSSATGTDLQSVCINTAIIKITYATKYATGASITGLPAGVTGSFTSNVFTISGSPSVSDTFNYTITLSVGCGTTIAKGRIIVKPDNTFSLSSASGTDSQSLCINTAIAKISYTTKFATGATFTGLPAGVNGSFAANEVSISGTPSISDTFNYSVTLTGGCGIVVAKGRMIVKPNHTIGLSSASGTDSQSVCINAAIAKITYGTQYATGATFSGLPAGVNGSFAANEVTISGTPSVSDTFNYSVTLTGGCGTATAKGRIIVKPNHTIGISSASGTDSQSVCINTAIAKITYATQYATGATFTGLPAGVNGSFSTNVVTISGTPSVSDTFNYSVTLTGGCGTATAKGRIIVKPNHTIGISSASGTDSQSVCINNAITKITYATKFATGATFTGLPTGVIGSFAANVVSIIGTPSVSGTFNYTVTLTGGCGTITAKGIIIVRPDKTITLSSAAGTDAQNVYINTAIVKITYSTKDATGATVSGLPAGVTGIYTTNLVTISGTPTVKGTFPYTITPTGGCGNITTIGSIKVGSLGLSNQAVKQVVQAFPNPANTEVNIKGTFTSSTQIEIVDVLGKMTKVNYSFEKDTFILQVSSLANGIYSIRITDKGEEFQYQIIVQH